MVVVITDGVIPSTILRGSNVGMVLLETKTVIVVLLQQKDLFLSVITTTIQITEFITT